MSRSVSGQEEGKLSRRKFLRNVVFTGTTLSVANCGPRHARAQTHTLHLYLAIWPSTTGLLLPWNTPSPRRLATEFCHLLWKYIDISGGRLGTMANIASGKRSVIGHISLLAELHYPDGSVRRTLFSNTGGNPGFYRNDNSLYSFIPMRTDRYPERYRRCWSCWPIVIGFYIGEVLAGHTTDGEWESCHDYQDRMRSNDDFRVVRYALSGDLAKRTYGRIVQIRNATARQRVVGAPGHFGLNTLSVRRIGDFDKPLSFSSHRIGNSVHVIHGGCANAVASVLVAAGLGQLVPNSARFRLELDLRVFKDVALPVILDSDAFRDGVPQDEDLISELSKVPERWGSGDTIAFVDPNYWYRSVSNDTRRIDLDRYERTVANACVTYRSAPIPRGGLKP